LSQGSSSSTLDVNFINVKSTNFSYEMSFWQLFSSDMYVKKRCSYEKFVRLKLMELTIGVTRFKCSAEASHFRENSTFPECTKDRC